MMPVELEEVVELICLVYHEARNVRHPMKDGLVQDTERYRKLRDGLATCRKEAWRQMESLRVKAVRSENAEGIAKAFEAQYGLTLPEIMNLYKAPIWKHSDSGGNAWASISARVLDLVNAMSEQDTAGQRALYDQILSMSHNTGKMCEKLAELRSL